MKRILLAFTILCSACSGNSSPTAPSPSPPPPVPPPTTSTLTGNVVTTNGGTPVTGTLSVYQQTVPIEAGRFTLPYNGAGILPFMIYGPGILTRSTNVTVANRSVDLDAISLSGGFDMAFYRKLIRNTYDAPATMEPLRRWIRTPNIYLKTVDEAGEPIHGPTLDLIEATLKDSVPQWTNGILGVPTVTRGTGSQVGVSGWLTVRFPSEARALCGQAQIGTDGGWIELTYHLLASGDDCRVTGAVVAPRTVRHEIGHALGFWHTGDPADLMFGGAWGRTADAYKQPAARELYHAAIAYRRPVGNLDPDADPLSTVYMTTMTAR